MNSELTALKKCKTLVDCARIIKGINYTNGRIKKEISEYCRFMYDIDIFDILKQNKRNYCLECGKEIQHGKKFCCSSCAAKYNNRKRKLSDETKMKISESLKKRNTKNEKKEHAVVCKNCGKIFLTTKKNICYCSQECAHNSEIVKEKIRKKAYERIENGTFSGWKVRSCRSYPEKFWEKVLDNNSINFIPEDFSTKKYFLDFLIEKDGKKIDLEIDGKQHKERKEHDIERDNFLVENGFVVYRIKWNSINSEVGKAKMKEKIDDFLRFYNEI